MECFDVACHLAALLTVRWLSFSNELIQRFRNGLVHCFLMH